MKIKIQSIAPMWLFVIFVCLVIAVVEVMRQRYCQFEETFSVQAITREQIQSKTRGPGTVRMIEFDKTDGTEDGIPHNYRNYDITREEEILGESVPPAYDSSSYPQDDNANSIALSGKLQVNPLRTTPSRVSVLDVRNNFRGDPSVYTPEVVYSSPVEYALADRIEHPWGSMNVPSTVGNEPRYDTLEMYNPTVVGCGSRRQPCDGGSQEVIPNWKPPRSVSGETIAPRDVRFPTWNEKPSQVGVLSRITGPENIEMPLYVKRIDQVTFFYFTTAPTEEKELLRVEGVYAGKKLGMNDEVRVYGMPGTFRVSQYQDDVGMLVPSGN
jgi:hypothetical protein